MEKISDFLSSLAKGVGLKPTEAAKLRQMREQFERDRKTNEDALEDLKSEILQVEERIKIKKGRYTAAHGLVKETLGEEIDLALDEWERKRAQKKLLLRNISEASTMLDRIRELEKTAKAADREVVIDDVSERMKTAFDELAQADRAMAENRDINYEGPRRDSRDRGERLAEVGGEDAETAAAERRRADRMKAVEGE